MTIGGQEIGYGDILLSISFFALLTATAALFVGDITNQGEKNGFGAEPLYVRTMGMNIKTMGMHIKRKEEKELLI